MIDNPRTKELFFDAMKGRLDRRQILKRAAALGIAAPAAAALVQMATISQAAAVDEGTLSITYYDWILNLHPIVTSVNEDFNATFPLSAEVAPTQGFGIDRFIAEAREGTSTWDAYIGATPFLEMIQLADSGAIEPWDPYLPEGFFDLIPESIRNEGSYNGNFYIWPFLLDICVQTWNAAQVEAAGLDASAAPATWDELIANARTVIESGAAPFGLVFDFHAWRSLIPIAHSINTDIYDENGLLIWNHDTVVEALEIMKQMMEVTIPDVLNEGTSDGGVNQTPDEVAFGQQLAPYYFKYQNAPMRYSATWQDPSQLRIGALPKTADGVGGTVFWCTGAALFANGANQQAAADYMMALTNDLRVWEGSIAGRVDEGVPPVGQLPLYSTIWDGFNSAPPEWLTGKEWAFDIWNALPNASAIAPSKLSITQFNVATPFYTAYLRGDSADARAALTEAYDAVQKEFAL
jgi:maltose-binding protein MalE